MGAWFDENVNKDWMKLRARIMLMLQEEAELDEIVKLVGMDALSAPDRLKLEAARSIREDFLHQNAFHETDTYTPLKKQYLMMNLVMEYFDAATDALKEGAEIDKLISLPSREKIGRFKYIENDKIDAEYEEILKQMNREIAESMPKEEF